MGLLAATVAGRLPAQGPAPIIDTIVIVNQNIFDEDLAELRISRGASSFIRPRVGYPSRSDQPTNTWIGARRGATRAPESQRVPAGAGGHGVRPSALRVRTEDGAPTPQLTSPRRPEHYGQLGIQEEKPPRHGHIALYAQTPDRSYGQIVYLNPHLSASGRGWRSVINRLTGTTLRGAWAFLSADRRQAAVGPAVKRSGAQDASWPFHRSACAPVRVPAGWRSRPTVTQPAALDVARGGAGFTPLH